jgi:putative DNA primase/helicase
MADTKKAFHEQVAEKLIEQLRQGTAPWQRPWEAGEAASLLPINPTTGKRYRGINAIQLMSQGRVDQRWLTYKQAVAAGAQVRKGEHGTAIQYWKFSEEHLRTDEIGKPVLDAQGKPVKAEVRLERPRVFFATVFNAEQIDGLPPMQRREQTWNAVERAEAILLASGAVIQHGGQNRAFYRLRTDSIHLPDKGQFPSADNYYAIALHELGHWTGHPSRLDRDLAHPFGSEGYAKEWPSGSEAEISRHIRYD